jgi:prepilin-type N-terminal cleavage/methylation domain-containing protein
MRTNRAFTLIELLVVIAIIAILAAILFPVFAQAKESAKKAKNLTHIKQIGTSMAIYQADYDDLFPQAITRRWQLRTVAWNVIHPIPHDWKLASGDYWTVPGARDQAQQQWSNATQPYTKNWQIHDDTGFTKVRSSADTADFANPNKQPASQNLVMNGLLHTLSTTEINQVAITPMLWNGYGKAAMEGRSMSNPNLRCDSTTPDAPCRFNPGAVPQPGASAGAGWFWPASTATAFVFQQGMNFTMCDTSAKFRRVGNETGYPGDPNTNYYGAPFAHIYAGGRPATMWFCTIAGGTASYPCFFRPDKDQG